MKTHILIALLFFITFNAIAQTQLQQLGVFEFENTINDVWGYQANGNEYALVGVQNGLSIVDVTNPESTEELFFWEGIPSTWRDIKTYNNFAYVVTEANAGMLIIDLSNLPESADTLTTHLDGYLNTCHNLYIDENGYLYLAGYTCDVTIIPAEQQGGVGIFNLNNPWQPEFEGVYTDYYCHDVYVRDNIMYTSEIYEGQMGIVDVNVKSNPVILGSTITPYNFAHNIWLSDNSQYAFTTDEKPGAYIASYDVSDPTDIIFMDSWRESESNTPHNTHVLNDFQIISYYLAGIQIIDSHQPDMLVQTEYFTTTVTESGTRGCWGAYPFLPSGNILASERSGLLYILGATYKQASYLQGNVTNAITGNPINYAVIEIDATNISESTDFLGNYKFGQPQDGTFTVTASAEGYQSQLVEIEFIEGEIAIHNFELQPAETVSTVVFVKNAATGELIPNSKINIKYFSQSFYANAPQGNLNVNDIYIGLYTITAGSWGFKSNRVSQYIGNSDPITIVLQPGYEDDFFFNLNWETENTCQQNYWINTVEPAELCIGQQGGDLACTLGEDIETDYGNNIIYFNANDLMPAQPYCAAKLTSQAIDLSSFENPELSFAYGSRIIQSDSEVNEDTIFISLEWDNNKVQLDYINSSKAQWNYKTYRLLDYLETLPNNAHFVLDFECNPNLDNGLQAEFAMDIFKVAEVEETSSISINENSKEFFQLKGNPFTENCTLTFNNQLTTNGVIDVYSINGSLIQSVLYNNQTSIEIGDNWQQGTYIIVYTQKGAQQSTKVVKL